MEIRPLDARDAAALAAFFEALAADEEAVHFFHPHPFDAASARSICEGAGRRKDEYFAAFEEGEVVGYGMLRGWDEGYVVPSFGGCVGARNRGQGLGRALLRHAVECAAARGAPQVMLKVYPENRVARSLYESEGFTFTERASDGVQLVGRLDLAPAR